METSVQKKRFKYSQVKLQFNTFSPNRKVKTIPGNLQNYTNSHWASLSLPILKKEYIRESFANLYLNYGFCFTVKIYVVLNLRFRVYTNLIVAY